MSQPNPQPGVRIGTAEREAAITALGEHMAAGRLEPDEYGDRVSTASAARTREDLDALFTDLPAPHPFPRYAPPAAPPRPARPWQRYVPESTGLRVLSAVLAVIVLITALPFVAVAAVLWFVVLPAVTCGGPWHRYRYRGAWRSARWR